MSLSDVEIFRLKWLPLVGGGLLLLYVYLAFISWPSFPDVALYLFGGALVLGGCIIGSKIHVKDDGIRMYYFNKLKWEQVLFAERRVILGLPYIYITRSNGGNWWLPLYFKGARNIREAIREKAPVANPVGVVCAGE